jgi:hypothetical protein
MKEHHDSTSKRAQNSRVILPLPLTMSRAYELFEERGCEPGRDIDDWLHAEVI